jgi:hypothetical protein
MARSSLPSDALIPEIRRAIWQIDPQVAVPTLKSMDDQVSDSVATDRFQAVVLTSFGAAALLLAFSECMAFSHIRFPCASRSSAFVSRWAPTKAR